MRHIKNFFHNINDIVLAVLIVAAAAGIICWRMQIILDYPKTLVQEQTAVEEMVDEETAPEEESAEETAAEGESAEETNEEASAEDTAAETAD